MTSIADKWNKLSAFDKGRVAAFIDGEGCVVLTSNNNSGYRYPRIKVANTAYKLVLWFKRKLGGYISTNTQRQQPWHKTQYEWSLASADSMDLAALLSPLLLLKSAQARVLKRCKRVGRGRCGSVPVDHALAARITQLNKRGK